MQFYPNPVRGRVRGEARRVRRRPHRREASGRAANQRAKPFIARDEGMTPVPRDRACLPHGSLWVGGRSAILREAVRPPSHSRVANQRGRDGRLPRHSVTGSDPPRPGLWREMLRLPDRWTVAPDLTGFELAFLTARS